MSYLPTSGPNIHGHVGKFSIHGAFRYQTFYPSIVLSRGFKVFFVQVGTPHVQSVSESVLISDLLSNYVVPTRT